MEEPIYTSIMESLTRGLNSSKSFRLIFKGDMMEKWLLRMNA